MLHGIMWFVNYISRKLFKKKLDAVSIEKESKEKKEHKCYT